MLSLDRSAAFHLEREVGTLQSSLYFLWIGLGLGMVMQVLVIAIQNAVEYRDLGVATSGAILFRLMGGSIGTAVLGTIFTARLHRFLGDHLPAGVTTSEQIAKINPQMLADLPQETRELYQQAFATSFSTVFVFATMIASCGFLLAWLLPEKALRKTIAQAAKKSIGEDAGESFAMPINPDVVQRSESGEQTT